MNANEFLRSPRKCEPPQLLVNRFSALLLCVAFLLPSCRSQSSLEWSSVKETIRKQFPSVHQLSTKELNDWLASPERVKPILLDARTSEEYAVSHLHEAHLASSEQEALKALDGVDRDHPIVVYCSVGYRSSALAKRLQVHGFNKVYNLEGSIFEWANEGRPVYSEGVEVKVVHPYNEKWGQLLDKRLWRTSPR